MSTAWVSAERGRSSVRKLLSGLVLLGMALRHDDDARAASDIVDLPVTFRVQNVNRSRVTCQTDGATYEVKGHLVAPRAALDAAAPRAVTLYMHGIGLGEWYWHFKAVEGYDYATEMARLGHVSVVYDQLGYGASGRPDGAQSCYGGEADMASQIIAMLRSGQYVVEGRSAPSFDRVALASNSIAGLMAEPEAYSFADIDALIVTAWADQGFSVRTEEEVVAVAAFCAMGGEPSDGSSGPGGYHYTPLSEAAFRELAFFDAEPAVIDAATAMRSRGPCGEPRSALATIAANQAFLREVAIPVLLVYGLQDEVHDQPGAGQQQAALYSGTSDLTTVFLDNTGHALTLERTHAVFRSTVSTWLGQRGFVGPKPCAAAPVVGCRIPGGPQMALLMLKDHTDDHKDRLVWRWRGAATAKAEFGNPFSATSYQLCVYDETAGSPGLVLSAHVPAGTSCGGRSCWRETATGFRYTDTALTHDGVRGVLLKAGLTPGTAKILVSGRGPNLRMPGLPLDQDNEVIVQITNSDGPCWEARYSAPASRNQTKQFKDRAE